MLPPFLYAESGLIFQLGIDPFYSISLATQRAPGWTMLSAFQGTIDDPLDRVLGMPSQTEITVTMESGITGESLTLVFRVDGNLLTLFDLILM